LPAERLPVEARYSASGDIPTATWFRHEGACRINDVIKGQSPAQLKVCKSCRSVRSAVYQYLRPPCAFYNDSDRIAGVLPGMNERTFKSMVLGLLVCAGSLCLNSHVVSGEEHNKEEHSRNFEHLLLLAEKQTAELQSETKRIKKELAEFEARNRELSAEVQSARQKMAQLQKEAETINAFLEREVR
jgi:hypothetical protein